MDCLQRGLTRAATIPERLIFEISEKSVVQVPEIVQGFMEELQVKGMSFALDDYGSGLTTLTVFRDFDFDIINLDGRLLRNTSLDRSTPVIAPSFTPIATPSDMHSVTIPL